MSTNKTQNYQLHAWGLADEPTLGEVNENFAKLDAALKAEETVRMETLQTCARVVTGSFTCTGAEMHIELGGRPAAVLVEHPAGVRFTSSSYVYGGLTCGDQGLRYMTLDNTGFTLALNSNFSPQGQVKVFLAVME